MSASSDDIEHFLHGQLDAWHAGDKDAFMALYRAASPRGLAIEYVGRPAREAWEILETMWADQGGKIEIEVLKKIINGTEAACLHRNHVRGTGSYIDTIEVYTFDEGRLSIRWFIAPVGRND